MKFINVCVLGNPSTHPRRRYLFFLICDSEKPSLYKFNMIESHYKCECQTVFQVDCVLCSILSNFISWHMESFVLKNISINDASILEHYAGL
jgi:hypothetical protein